MGVDLPPLSVTAFGDFLNSVHRGPGGQAFSPFPWQDRLAARAVAGDWAPQLVVPTGLGKSTVIDIAVFALACQAHLPPRERTARTRTFVVIDRRIVVDDLTEHALELQRALDGALEQSQDDVVGRVATRLLHISDGDVGIEEPAVLGRQGRPLDITRMRGGTTWAARWIWRVEQPAVVLGTVDQLASRLLFRGYGVTAPSRPIDAALVGSDSLIVLDEAHLVEPLRSTIASLQSWEAHSLTAPVLPQRAAQLVTMSATTRRRDTGDTDGVLDIDDADLSHPVAGLRLRARKETSLWEVAGGPRGHPEASARVGDILAVAARRLADSQNDAGAVGIVCNRVATARRVHGSLLEGGEDTELLIGPSRGIDRELAMKRIRARAGVGRQMSGQDPQRSLFVVATQTIEVGVNLDFDALVTEAASFDALVQRLGRLDRLGQRHDRSVRSPAVIVYNEAAHREDAVYGEAITATWEWLAGHAEPFAVKGARGPHRASIDGDLDLGPVGLRSLTCGTEVTALFAPVSRTPTVFPGDYLRAWSATAPAPLSDLDIVPFIRGDNTGLPAVTLLWRADVSADSADELRESAGASLSRCAPCPEETVEVPIWHVRRWLSGLDDADLPLADVATAGEMPDARAAADSPTRNARVARVEPNRECSVVTAATRLSPGDVLVCPSSLGGLDCWGWAPESVARVVDVADLCETRRGRTIRLHPETLTQLGGPGESAQSLWTVTQAWFDHLGEWPAGRTRVPGGQARSLIKTLRGAAEGGETRGEYLRMLGDGLGSMEDPSRWAVRVDLDRGPAPDNGNGGINSGVLRAFRRLGRHGGSLDETASDQQSDADDSSALTGRPEGQVGLDQHGDAVAARARASAKRIGLPDDLVEAVTFAARFHDLGKADPRFQVMLRRGEAFAFVPGDELLAKSGMDPTDKQAMRDAARASGWSRGPEHEALSVALFDRLVDENPEIVDKGIPGHLDLIRHLIGAHHGENRPLFMARAGMELVDVQTQVDEVHVALAADQLAAYVVDWSSPARFRTLTERHGAWGLALLETIVRLADMNCSEAGT